MTKALTAPSSQALLSGIHGRYDDAHGFLAFAESRAGALGEVGRLKHARE